MDFYRELYDAILEDGPEAAGAALAGLDEERRWLEAFAGRRGAPIPPATHEELWRLYALSRVIDTLLAFDWDPAGFLNGLGIQAVHRPAFHPFFHEIVKVEPGEDVAVLAEHSSTYMIGPLLIARARCTIRAPYPPEIAERSTMYWASRRPNRPASDLSHGWGHNSLWRTSFRRDYLIDGVMHYNADPHGHVDDTLTPAERLELLRHRCFVTCTKHDDDRWPYSETYSDV